MNLHLFLTHSVPRSVLLLWSTRQKYLQVLCDPQKHLYSFVTTNKFLSPLENVHASSKGQCEPAMCLST